jgi:hypothetical protein
VPLVAPQIGEPLQISCKLACLQRGIFVILCPNLDYFLVYFIRFFDALPMVLFINFNSMWIKRFLFQIYRVALAML